MSKVSVIVPIYNAGKKLDKCIRSIINQTFKDIEIILVNDGSLDNSLLICHKYKEKDNRIKLINKKNEGSIPTRRRGIVESSSTYIMFVDADDWIDKKTVEILYDEIVNNSADIVVCNIFKVLGNGFLIKHKNTSKYFSGDKIYSEEKIKEDLVVAYLYGHPFPAGLVAKLYRKELLLNSGKYLKEIKFLGDDLFYNMEVFLKARKVKVINNPLYYYRYGGFTSKYMPYLFDDMVNGYQIQKEVINEYYPFSKQSLFKGISIMLLNTFKTCLYNLFNSGYDENKIKNIIEEYTNNINVIECTNNKEAMNYFSLEYLNAIKNNDIDLLYNIGKSVYTKKKPKKIILKLVNKIPFI